MESTISFIEVVKRHQAIYDTTHKDYKNIERKAKAWQNVADEAGLSIDTCKRKWKNLRDSYTKYLRSFRVGSKTSRKYQFWAHANHMDFLRPFQGPGRTQPHIKMENYQMYSNYPFKDEPFCDLGFEMVEKCSPDEPYNPDNTEREMLDDKNNIICSSTPTEITLGKRPLTLKDIDATSMFFLSLAKTVKNLPRKKQASVKMLCMKIVSDAELETESSLLEVESSQSAGGASSMKMQNGTIEPATQSDVPADNNYEHFLYVMSPSKVEAMIDISSDEECPK